MLRESDLRSLGIDAERNAPLPTEMLRLICTERERGEMPSIPGASVTALYFSAKEAVYKAWYPLARRRLGIWMRRSSSRRRLAAFEPACW